MTRFGVQSFCQKPGQDRMTEKIFLNNQPVSVQVNKCIIHIDKNTIYLSLLFNVISSTPSVTVYVNDNHEICFLNG